MFFICYLDSKSRMHEDWFDLLSEACEIAQAISRARTVVHVYEGNDLYADYYLGEEVDDL